MTLGHLLRGIIALQACLFLFFLISGSQANDHVMVRRHLEKKEFYKRQYAYDGDVKGNQNIMSEYAERAFEASKNHDTNALRSVINDVLNTPNLNQPTEGTWAKASLGQIDTQYGGDVPQVGWYNGFPTNPTPNVDPAQVNGDLAWKGLPSTLDCKVEQMSVAPNSPAFLLDETSLNVTDEKSPAGNPIVQPFYVSHPDTYDRDQVKRVIITLPGKPRDAWNYVNLHFNAREFLIHNQTLPKDEAILAAPVFLNQNDKEAGAVKENYLYFKNSHWANGGASHGPEMSHSVTSYRVLDLMAQHFIKTFPNLNQIVFAGHSMGAQAVQRYAVVKNPKWYDPALRFWIGNPGSWAWITSERPNNNPSNLNGESCEDKIDAWPFGIGDADAMPKYVKDSGNPDLIRNRFLKRTVGYSLGLLDNGQGNTQCAAQYQGYSHLQRGSYFMQMLCEMPGGFPKTHTLAYIAGVSHQDYEMIAATETTDFVFMQGRDAPPISSLRPHRTHHHRPHPRPPPSKGSNPYDWEGPHYRNAAWGIIAGIAAVLIIGFFGCHYLFKANANDWDRDYWEYDSKRRLL